MFAHGSVTGAAVSAPLRACSMARWYCCSICSVRCFLSLSRISKGSFSLPPFCAKAGAARTTSAMAPKNSFFINVPSCFLQHDITEPKAAQSQGILAQSALDVGITLTGTGRSSGMSLSHYTPLAISGAPRQDWTRAEVRALFALPFTELIFRAAQFHRANFDPSEVQISTLLSIKTGGCPEDCAYCPQSAKFDTGVKAEKVMDLDTVLAEARAAKAGGASRFCMGAAWRSPKDRDLDKVCAMV